MPDPCPGQRSAFVFAFHKSGSSMANEMLSKYCADVGIPTFSLFDAAFQQGVSTDQIQADAAACFSREGYLYTGFRHFPNFDLDLYQVPAVLLARDPRDMLVSLYFSVGKSHVIPKGHRRLRLKRHEAQGMTIDEFVVGQAGLYTSVLQRYRECLQESDLSTYRYEDIIYKKEEWLTRLVDKFGLPKDDKLIAAAAKRVDVFPRKEKENRHIRQVHPGNFRSKLSTGVIEQLNDVLGEFLDYFGYER